MSAKNVMVSFSKRRHGLFRKASELCTKCDAQIAVIVVSPAGNPFAFGHPSVDHILRRATAGFSISDAGERSQVSKLREVEGLKARVKASNGYGDLECLIDAKIGSCESVDELESLKLYCLSLQQLISRKLKNDVSFLRSQEQQDYGFGFGIEDKDDDDDAVLDLSRLFEDHKRNVSDDNLLLISEQTDTLSFPTVNNDWSFFMDVAMDKENDTSFFSEFGRSATTGTSSGSESDPRVLRNGVSFPFIGTRGSNDMLCGAQNDTSFPFVGTCGTDGVFGGAHHVLGGASDTSFPFIGTHGTDGAFGGAQNDTSFSLIGTAGSDGVFGARNDTLFTTEFGTNATTEFDDHLF